MTSRNIGVLLIFTIGAYADYSLVPCIFIFFPLVFLICFFILPNTPQFYLRRGKTEEADSALKYYKGYEVEPEAIKGLLFGITFGWLIQFPGGITFLNYAVLIISSILLAIAQLIGYSLGRKLLLSMSLIGSATGLLIFALYLYLIRIGYDLSAFTWLPVTSLLFIMFISFAGVYALFSVCFVEYLPSKIRTMGLTICVLSVYASSFTFFIVFPSLLELIELRGCTIIFMMGSILGALFVIFILKETKGRHSNQAILNARRNAMNQMICTRKSIELFEAKANAIPFKIVK